MSRRHEWHRRLHGRKWQGRRHRRHVLPGRPRRTPEGPTSRRPSASGPLQWSTVAFSNSNDMLSENGTLSDSNFAQNANVS
jgi:hypothetical protein